MVQFLNYHIIIRICGFFPLWKNLGRFTNRLAQHASGYQPILGVLPAISADDWRKEIIDYLKDPSRKVEGHVSFQATKYVLLDEELY